MILYAYFLNNKLFCVSDATEKCKEHGAKYWQEKANKELPEDGHAKILYIEVPKEMEMVTKALLRVYKSERKRSLRTIQIYLDRINSEVSNLNSEFINLVKYYKIHKKNYDKMNELIGKRAFIIAQGKRFEGTITSVFKEKGIWMIRLNNEPFHTYYAHFVNIIR